MSETDETSWPELALKGQRAFAIKRGRELAALRQKIEDLTLALQTYETLGNAGAEIQITGSTLL